MIHRLKGLVVGLLLAGPVAGVLLFWDSPLAVGQAVQEGRQILIQADALRKKGDWEKAGKAYEMAAEKFGSAQKMVRAARQMVEFCSEMPNLKSGKLKNGVYEATEMGYVADIKVAVKISRGRISGVAIVEHKENRPLKSLENVPPQIVRKQTPSVDATTGATITSYAVMNAARKAMEQAKTTEDDKDDDKKDGDTKDD